MYAKKMQNLANYMHVLCTLSSFYAIFYADFLCGFLMQGLYAFMHILYMFYALAGAPNFIHSPKISVYASFMQVLCKLCKLCVLEMFMHFMHLALC
jgi:hypothetical protein